MSELLKLNVNDHVEKKNGLSYLSWAWAWAEVLKIDPRARWHAVEYGDERGNALPCMFLPDGSAMVKTEVMIKGDTKTCLLPVMDHRNKAIKNPDAFAINTAIMRCMTKAVSMHGLGLYIYAGEDLPESEEPETQPAPQQYGRPARRPSGVAAEVLETAPALSAETMKYLVELAGDIESAFAAGGPKAGFERIEIENLDDIQKIYLSTQLPSNIRNPITAYSRELRKQPKKETA